MASTVTEVIQPTAAMDTVHVKLQTKASGTMAPHPPLNQKFKVKLRLEPQRALQPARKKLSTLEAQRIMAVLVDSIKRTELMAALPFVMENMERFSVVLGAQLMKLLEDHKVIIQSFEELKQGAERLLQQEEDHDQETGEKQDTEAGGSRPTSATSVSSQVDSAMRNLSHVAKQMQVSCKNILRAFSENPAAVTAVLKEMDQRTENLDELLTEMNELKDIIMNMLLTTPVEEDERDQYLKEIAQREKFNASAIDKLQVELQAAIDDRDNEVRIT